MLFDGSIGYLVMYHYKSNAILATPIAGLDDVSIFNACKLNFQSMQKGYKPKLNAMDNQATKHIKQFLTKEECKLQLVKLHNHRVIAAKRAIQTFKDALIAALATTNRNFPLQLWDKLTPQESICSMCCPRPASIPQNMCTKSLTAGTIGIVILLCPLATKLLYTMMAIHEGCGHHKVSMVGI
jgi:hypothetical protein